MGLPGCQGERLAGNRAPVSQLRFDLERPPSQAREEFVVSASNAAAVAAVDAWPDWIGGALALTGPEGVGKTHLAAAWAKRAGAVRLAPDVDLGAVALGERPVLIEDADRVTGGETLFHLLNRAAAGRGTLLLTARTRPTAWPCALPDLRSRLNALAVAELGEPDDALLTAVLERFLRARSITPLEDVLAYIVKRIERSVPRARELAAELDREMDARRRPLTKLLAREVLDRDGETPDLFEGPSSSS
jgi:chromosomal replication initiation ATPase DnaA